MSASLNSGTNREELLVIAEWLFTLIQRSLEHFQSAHSRVQESELQRRSDAASDPFSPVDTAAFSTTFRRISP